MTQTRATPTVKRRRVGAQLRRWREAARLTNGDVAKLPGWDPTRVSRVERGVYTISAEAVRQLTTFYGVTDEVAITEVSAAAEEKPGRSWWSAYSGTIPQAYMDFVGFESAATAIRTYHPTVVTGLLQGPHYMREILTRAPTESMADRIESLVSLRFARQQILVHAAEPVQLTAFIPESALHAHFDDPQIMREQLKRLIEVSNLPNAEVRLVPLTSHPTYVSNGPVTVFNFRHPWVPVGSIDNPMGGTQTEDPQEVAHLNKVLDQVASAALPVRESRNSFREYLKGVGHDRNQSDRGE